jgi:hypothetical protein
MDGMETLHRLRQKSDLPVIFLTSKEEEMDELFGLKMGADDFIRKPFSHRLLVERVKVLLRRATTKDGAPAKEAGSNVLERGQLRMDPERHSCTWKNEPVTLTVTEFLILQALASRPGVVKSRNAVMDAVMTKRSMWTTEPSTATSSGCAGSSRQATSSSIWSRRFMALAIVSKKYEHRLTPNLPPPFRRRPRNMRKPGASSCAPPRRDLPPKPTDQRRLWLARCTSRRSAIQSSARRGRDCEPEVGAIRRCGGGPKLSAVSLDDTSAN